MSTLLSRSMYRTCLSIARRQTALQKASTGRRYLASAETTDFLEHFLRQQRPPQRDLEYFSRIPWARSILEDEAYETVPFFSRHLNSKTGENRFLAETVNSEGAIPHFLSRRRKRLETPAPIAKPEDDLANPRSISPNRETIFDVLCLVSLRRGLDSHASIAHGGFQCVLFDEAIRFLILLHHNNGVRTPGPRDRHLTVSLTATYLAPLKTPSDILLRSRLVARDGRKWFTEAEIVDSTGVVVTKAVSTWVTAKRTL